MNTQKLKELRDYIVSLPEEKFVYRTYWEVDGKPIAATTRIPPECGTPGCIAGHCISKYRLKLDQWEIDASDASWKSPAMIAADYLGLTGDEMIFLFLAKVGKASRNDAIRRMDWLLLGYKYEEYDYSGESWFNPPAQVPHHQTQAAQFEEKPVQIQQVPTHHRDESTAQRCVYRESHPQTERQLESLVSENESPQLVAQT